MYCNMMHTKNPVIIVHYINICILQGAVRDANRNECIMYVLEHFYFPNNINICCALVRGMF